MWNGDGDGPDSTLQPGDGDDVLLLPFCCLSFFAPGLPA
jgi:hypothetical protein